MRRAARLTLGAALLALAACQTRRSGAVPTPADVYPAAPQAPRVVALGNLRGEPPTTKGEADLARFLFGVEPEPPLGLVKPVCVAARGADLLIGDVALRAVFQWSRADAALSEARLQPRPGKPIAIASAPDGGLLVADAAQRLALRYGAGGELQQRFGLEGQEFRPADVVCVGQELWASNTALHRIDVFDLNTGGHLRSIGRRGAGPGEFAIPLGLAHGPDGNVYVVDMLNARVQVLSPGGKWVRNIGGPGDRVGAFGRPKDVAVGPDGAVFVVDSASQRVHAFDRDGRALLAFGASAPGGGGLLLPAGVAISPLAPAPIPRLPVDFVPAYFVLVTEQLNDIGVRVFAWSASAAERPDSRQALRATDEQIGTFVRPGQRNAAGRLNPHWSASDCAACHQAQAGQPLPIAVEKVDAKCLSCHDGKNAAAEAHPIGRVAARSGLRVPEWPLVNGQLGCLTCHDVARHCAADRPRPSRNAVMLRGQPFERPSDFCANCHVQEQPWRTNPHQVGLDGTADEANCLLCHTQAPPVSGDNPSRSNPMLRDATSNACLRCHSRHWDYAPGGHIGRAATPQVLDHMRQSAQRPGGRAIDLPLNDGTLTCYTCHDPHPPGRFPGGGALSRRATESGSARLALRARQIDLCLACHEK